MTNTITFIPVKMKSGNEVHAAVKGYFGRSLCGRRPAFKMDGHEVTCEKCASVMRDMENR